MNDSNASSRKRRTIPRRILRVAGFAALAVALLFAGKRVSDLLIVRSLNAAPAATPLRLESTPPEAHDGYAVHRFSFESGPGERVPVLGVVPAAAGRHPAIVFLYGIGMKMDFSPEVAKLLADSGHAIFIPEQYGRGQRKVAKRPGLLELLTIRRRLVLTIRETRRLVDILMERPDVDPRRIYLWGVSFGALTGCSVAAYDRRIAGAVFTAGAGDFPTVAARSPYLFRSGGQWWEPSVARFAAELLRPFDPVRHIGRIAPRPVLLQNATRDEIFPREAVQTMFDAAGEPKDIHWFESAHDHPTRETIESLIRDGLAWIDRTPGFASSNDSSENNR